MFIEKVPNSKELFGWIEVICGSMFSGKTEELIRRLKRAKFAKQPIGIFKPVIDDRFDSKNVVSHDSTQIKSTSVKSASEIIDLSNGCKVVGIDEAQFFDHSIVKICNSLAYNGCRVIIAGLDMDFKGNPFGPMPDLMAIAEDVLKVHAVCVETGRPAGYSYRKDSKEDLVLIGEKKEYEPLSREAFKKKMANKKRT